MEEEVRFSISSPVTLPAPKSSGHIFHRPPQRREKLALLSGPAAGLMQGD